MRIIGRFAVLGALAVALIIPIGSAGAAPTHPTYALGSAKSCKANYVEKIESHKVKGKEVRYIACVYKAPKAPAKTASSNSATQCTGTCKFTFSADESGFTSVALNKVTQGVPCPDSGLCDATSSQRIDDVNVTMCAGSGGVSDPSLATDDFSLALSNGKQGDLDSVTDDPDVSTAFGNYGAVAPKQCITGDLYFDTPPSVQWTSLNYSYTSSNLLSQTVYVWHA